MLTSPQTVTLSGTAFDLNKTIARETSSVYNSADGSLKLDISHQETKTRKRHLAKLTRKKTVTDPITGLSSEGTASVHFVFDEPKTGFEDAELDALAAALATWFGSTTRLAILTGRH